MNPHSWLNRRVFRLFPNPRPLFFPLCAEQAAKVGDARVKERSSPRVHLGRMLSQVLLHHAALPPIGSDGSTLSSPRVLQPGQGIADGDYDDRLHDPTAALSLVPRNRSRLNAWNEPPDDGTFPRVVIAGMGKCGTNALAEALARLGFDDPSLTNVWAQDDEIQRQGFSGEVNWQCGSFAHLFFR